MREDEVDIFEPITPVITDKTKVSPKDPNEYLLSDEELGEDEEIIIDKNGESTNEK